MVSVASLPCWRYSYLYECFSFDPNHLAWDKERHSPSLLEREEQWTKDISLEKPSMLPIYEMDVFLHGEFGLFFYELNRDVCTPSC